MAQAGHAASANPMSCTEPSNSADPCPVPDPMANAMAQSVYCMWLRTPRQSVERKLCSHVLPERPHHAHASLSYFRPPLAKGGTIRPTTRSSVERSCAHILCMSAATAPVRTAIAQRAIIGGHFFSRRLCGSAEDLALRTML